MTTLLVQATSAPLIIDLPWIIPMTEEQFYEFCLANRDLRIERTASGEVIVMPPAFSDTGNRNFNIAAQLWNWTERDGTGLGFDSSTGFTLPNGATRSPDAAWIKEEYIANGTLLGWLIDRQNRQVYIYRPHREPEILNAPETISGAPELPGFELVMAKIW